MGVKWTKEQQQVIDLRNRNILVSAAAGSGKTAVLVQRIISMLTDRQHPVNVDQLLIVTFTEAAAAEMKDRIRSAIEAMLDEQPEDEHLQRQATLIHSANITTIHSFCLMVIRENFHRISLDPGFRIGEEGELKLLKQDVLEVFIEEIYDQAKPEFLDFVESYAIGRDDRKLDELILSLYEYSRSYPEPECWLQECADTYETVDALEEAVFIKKAEEMIHNYLRDAADMLAEGCKICQEPDGPYMYLDMLESDLKLINQVGAGSTFKELETGFRLTTQKGAFVRLSTKKDPAVSEEKKARIKQIRELVKKLVKELREQYFYEEPEVLLEEMKQAAPAVKVLTELTKTFSGLYEEKKRARGMIDFSDMEQYALRILTEEQDGKRIPSLAAREYQNQFAEVMIDEYQDSNLIQEAILTSVSREVQGAYNIFMVGDVKQSIYRFRLSRPELFMEKYHTYSLEEGDHQRIDLSKNFRSRQEVLGSANDIFRQIMTTKLGGIDYDDRAALYPGAAYEPVTNAQGESVNRTELLLVDTQQETEVTDTDRKLEARAVAYRIKELVGRHPVSDSQTGELRKACYRDMVILTRSMKGWSEPFLSILEEEGIPAYAGKNEGYFETYEVALLLDYLRVLDNQRQDIPLTAVLTSPMGGLEAEDLAWIRGAFPDHPFYEAVSYCAGEENPGKLPEEIHVKLKQVMDTLIEFRKRVPYLAIHELLWEIMDVTGYEQVMSAMPGGMQRQANIEMLMSKAAAFESSSYKGLFNFVRYMEQLQKYEVDYGEANINDEQADAVRMLSIHKSKGLEFPIVFVVGMSKRFNRQDAGGSMVIHPTLGIGIDQVDLEMRTKTPTILKRVMQKEILMENQAEELRVLYVALTRAKEKLIMTGTLTNAAEKLSSYKKERTTDGKMSFTHLVKATSYLDWVLPVVVDMQENGTIALSLTAPEKLAVLSNVQEQAEELAEATLLNWDVQQAFIPEFKENLEKQFAYCYPYQAENQMKMKFTVSELKKHQGLAEEAGELLFSEPESIPPVLHSQGQEAELTGASRGTAYHRVMELLDFSKSYDYAKLEMELGRLTEEGKLSQEMRQCIEIEDILRFLNSSGGKRMQQAARFHQLRKEQPFVLAIDAKEVYPDLQGEKDQEYVLVQGIIDVCFQEEDEMVVLDYKTDKVRSMQKLREKYHVQLEYYAKALEQLTGKKVKEQMIYSFTLGEEISWKRS